MIKLPSGKLKTFISNRWFVFVAAMWVQSCAGVGYLFGSLSPVIKSAMGNNQRQVAKLGVAKDLSDGIGFLVGSLSEILPIWGILLIGVFQNLIGYGFVWLIVTSRVPFYALVGVILSELEEEKTIEIDSLPAIERQKRINELQAKLVQAAASGAVTRRRRGPHRDEDFTLLQALRKADFLLMFVSLVLASGSGLTIIDNMGQICESLGYSSSSVFVSMISIWNFLGRVGGGYFSEVVVRKYAYPRPVVMAVAQIIMAMGLFYYAMGWPGAIYVITVLIGLGYGAHWAIVPAATSELFGLKSFGALYNFLTLASTTGSLFFSGVIASGIYDYEVEKQASLKLLVGTTDSTTYSCTGVICYSITCAIMSGFCLVAVGLSMIVVYRTQTIYAQLYGKALT